MTEETAVSQEEDDITAGSHLLSSPEALET